MWWFPKISAVTPTSNHLLKLITASAKPPDRSTQTLTIFGFLNFTCSPAWKNMWFSPGMEVPSCGVWQRQNTGSLSYSGAFVSRVLCFGRTTFSMQSCVLLSLLGQLGLHFYISLHDTIFFLVSIFIVILLITVVLLFYTLARITNRVHFPRVCHSTPLNKWAWREQETCTLLWWMHCPGAPHAEK